MKVFLYFIGIAFAFVFSVSVSAKTSSGEIMTMCKSTVKESMDGVTRIRTSKFKEKASGTKITFRVSSENNQTRKVTCTYANGVATLTDPIRLAASKSQQNLRPLSIVDQRPQKVANNNRIERPATKSHEGGSVNPQKQRDPRLKAREAIGVF